ncbi:MAG: hypothetical protein R2795_09670 [Saprospiraceae bacterium]
MVRTWWLSPHAPIAQARAYQYDAAEIMQTSNVVISREEVEDARFVGSDVSVNLTNTEFRCACRKTSPPMGIRIGY